MKKLHRRQVSTASAKMFALNEEIFSGVENDYGNSNSDIPPVHVDQEQKENDDFQLVRQRHHDGW